LNRKKSIEIAFKRVSELSLDNPEYKTWVKRFTIDIFNQDVGTGDLTTQALFKTRRRPTTAVIQTKESGVVAGLEEASWFYDQLTLTVQPWKKDGDRVQPGDILCEVIGPENTLLEAERTGLKVLQRMSGIATITRHCINAVRKAGSIAEVVATRKTHWPLLDKKAVVLGGGGTHRLGLWDAILIKDNHLEELKQLGYKTNYIEEALQRAWGHRFDAVFIEIEVGTPQEAITAAKTFKILQKSPHVSNTLPCVIMFDNMLPNIIRDVHKKLQMQNLYDHVLLEASGGIRQENIDTYANAGVDIISLGSLTHSPKALDINQTIL
jgi:nicotinate-nucleotide pyrophosphorylase (carboxylating)